MGSRKSQGARNPRVSSPARKTTPAPKTNPRDTASTSASVAPRGKQSGAQQSREKSIPIVGIGASAGGLEAFTELLEHLPLHTGMAFVLVQHLDPKRHSMLTELLSRATKMPVREVQDGMAADPNMVYVMPPNRNIAFSQGALSLVPRKPSEPHMPIDYFFRSVAQDETSKAIGVILSGTATDGTLGLTAIKAEGGITFAQDEKSAKYSGMPLSAVRAGCVDFVLPPKEIAKELARIARHPYVAHPRPEKVMELAPAGADVLSRIFGLLQKSSALDFTYYNQGTIQRRIRRRMALHRVDTLKSYLAYLNEHPAEVEALYQDILINVTSFFRDPQTYRLIAEKVLPKILQNRPPETPIRVWVPGCATGEEAYSLAICLLEGLGSARLHIPIQIFATDVSDAAIQKARDGVYMENIAADVSPERLRRFFVKVTASYQVSETIREMCIFARQDLAKDPPFGKLDLISCRNVLIYLGPVLQKRILPLFHYALAPTGFLVLGSSETVGEFTDLFSPLESKHKIYAKKAKAPLQRVEFFLPAYQAKRGESERRTAPEVASAGNDLQRLVDRVILNKYDPASVVVNENLEILQFRGHTGPYLEPGPGRASLNLLKMAREGLLAGLQTAFFKAKKAGQPIQKTGLRIKYDGQIKEVQIEVIPVKGPSLPERHFLILFAETKPVAEAKEAWLGRLKPGNKKDGRNDHERKALRLELEETRNYLQSSTEQQEATGEELTAANEELQAGNEELQSINEEMETAKEELQATNEELTTVNEELSNRNLELAQLNNDLNNLIISANIPIVMLGSDLRIRRFTPIAEKVLNLIPTDIGRPIGNIKPNLNVQDLEKLVSEVIETLHAQEREVQDREGVWHLLRVLPYKTAENKIEGAVLSLMNIDARKRAEEALRSSAEEQYRLLFHSNPEPMWVFDLKTLGFLTVNEAALHHYGYSVQEFLDMTLKDIYPPEYLPALQENLAKLPEARQVLRLGLGGNWQHRKKDGTLIDVQVAWNPITFEGKSAVLCTCNDVTARRRAEESVRQLSGRLLQSQDEERRRIARELHDATSQQLAGLALNLALFEGTVPETDSKARKLISESVALVQQTSREINVLSYLLHPPLLDEVGLIAALRWFADGFAQRSGLRVGLDLPEEAGRLPRDRELALFRVVQESLTNIHRHSGSPTARIRLVWNAHATNLEVSDEGRGIPAEILNTETGAVLGPGMGIAGMQERVKQLGGELKIDSSGQGTVLRVTLPRHKESPS